MHGKVRTITGSSCAFRQSHVPGRSSPVVVVEDDNDARAALGSLLTAEGYQVALAADGREAMKLMTSGVLPALILLDMILPTEDGWSFMAKRRANPSLTAIPVIIVTGLTVASDEWAKSLGAVALLRKPSTKPACWSWYDSTARLEQRRQAGRVSNC